MRGQRIENTLFHLENKLSMRGQCIENTLFQLENKQLAATSCMVLSFLASCLSWLIIPLSIAACNVIKPAIPCHSCEWHPGGWKHLPQPAAAAGHHSCWQLYTCHCHIHPACPGEFPQPYCVTACEQSLTMPSKVQTPLHALACSIQLQVPCSTAHSPTSPEKARP